MKAINLSLCIIILIGTLLLVLSGCSNDFDRKDAKKIISQAYNLPYVETRQFYDANIKTNGFTKWETLYPMEDALQQQGFRIAEILETFDGQGIAQWPYAIVSIKFTNKVDKYVISKTTESDGVNYKIKVSDITFGKITGLRKVNESEYEVEFNLKRTPTEIGEILLTSKGKWIHDVDYYVGLRQEDFQNIKHRILKYDDGWRISNEEIEKVQKKIDPENSRN